MGDPHEYIVEQALLAMAAMLARGHVKNEVELAAALEGIGRLLDLSSNTFSKEKE